MPLVLVMVAVGLLGCEQVEPENVSELELPVESEECCGAFEVIGGCNVGGQHTCCTAPETWQGKCQEDCAGEYYSCRNESWCNGVSNWMGEGECNSPAANALCRELCELRCATPGFCVRGHSCVCWGSGGGDDPPPI